MSWTVGGACGDQTDRKARASVAVSCATTAESCRGTVTMRQVAILVGGVGSRLGALTSANPKPVLDVGGKPFLEYLLDEIARYGVFEEILLLAGHHGDEVARRYHDRTWRTVKIRVVVEPTRLGTGGALKHAGHLLDPSFVLMNGDSFLDFNLLDLVAGPWRGGMMARMALLADHPGDRYGRVELAGNRVTAFHASTARTSGPINAGVYLFQRNALDLIGSTPCSLESDLLKPLAQQGVLEGKIYEGFFIDIGVPEDLARADRELPAQVTRPAVFFDRDGVLNEDIGYPHRPDQIVWMENAKQAIKECNDRAAFAFVVSNQAGVARGYYDEAMVIALHTWMNRELAQAGAHIDEFEYCPHHEDAALPNYRRACRRRKPRPGMITDLLRRWPVDRNRSILVGDKASDLAAAESAGVKGVLFPGGDLSKFLRPHLECLVD